MICRTDTGQWSPQWTKQQNGLYYTFTERGTEHEVDFKANSAACTGILPVRSYQFLPFTEPFFPFHVVWCKECMLAGMCVCVTVCACVCVCGCSHMSCISLKWPPLLPDHSNYSVLTRGCLCQQMESQAVILLESSSWFDGTCRTVNYGFISAKMYHFSLRLPPVSSVCLCVCMYA